MYSVDKSSFFWKYLSPGQKGLIDEGLYLLNDIDEHPDLNITDFSYLVFPFAKAYEGFLKELFKDLGFISENTYNSNHFRIGKALNPHLERVLRGESVYDKIVQSTGGRDLADEMLDIWRRGRNLVFHYFPHNLKALSKTEAEMLIQQILEIMKKSVEIYKGKIKPTFT